MSSRTWTQTFFGGKPPDPKEQANQWRQKLKKEIRQLERQITGIDREEAKIVKEIKKAAKEGQMDSAKMLAREVARSRKAKERILIAKTNVNSLEMQISSQLATIRVAGAMEKSAELMKVMNEAIKMSAISQTMKEMSKEMEQAGIIDELITEAFEDMEDPSLEEEADIEVDKVLADLGLEVAGALPAAAATAPARAKASTSAAQQPVQQEEDDEEEDEELAQMQARIAALR
eukprot:Tamp_07015.p1 GENE.Tamp_07015~~Tamp_07015.p1  ORF type:complete len:232 (+),score=83.95 Tamp_07015:340-1035(+)